MPFCTPFHIPFRKLFPPFTLTVSKGLKFVPTPVTDENYIRRQLMLDFEHFARRMRLKDTMDFVNFIGKTKVSQDTILGSMGATSLYTNIPQEEGITTLCKAYEAISVLYRHTTSKKYLNLSFRKIHSNLLETIIFRPMELQWYKNGRWVNIWPILKQN